jgi:hypothetical protein
LEASLRPDIRKSERWRTIQKEKILVSQWQKIYGSSYTTTYPTFNGTVRGMSGSWTSDRACSYA